MYTPDNQLPVQIEGQGDWDSALNLAMGVLERGFHTTARAGYAVATLDLLWLDPNGFFQKYDPRSLTTRLHALAFTGAASGDSLQALLSGIVRGGLLSTTTPFDSGKDYFADPAGTGTVVVSANGTDQRVGFGVWSGGFYFNPAFGGGLTNSAYIMVAAAAVNTGYAFNINAAGEVRHFDPNSESSKPHGVLATGGTGVGSLVLGIPFGAVNSLVSNGTLTPGEDYYSSATTPGLIVRSYSAASRRIGYAMSGARFMVSPAAAHSDYERLTSVTTITIAPTSEHLFIIDIGKQGWVRDLLMKSVAADKVGLAFYTNSDRSNLIYQTISGGVTTVTSFTDRAGWPYENTDATTLSGKLYGKIWPDSGAVVASQDVQVRLDLDRWR
jgi:hypothetical protein